MIVNVKEWRLLVSILKMTNWKITVTNDARTFLFEFTYDIRRTIQRLWDR
jgi:hypothetical protein